MAVGVGFLYNARPSTNEKDYQWDDKTENNDLLYVGTLVLMCDRGD